jgi:hypothetical protein
LLAAIDQNGSPRLDFRAANRSGGATVKQIFTLSRTFLLGENIDISSREGSPSGNLNVRGVTAPATRREIGSRIEAIGTKWRSPTDPDQCSRRCEGYVSAGSAIFSGTSFS